MRRDNSNEITEGTRHFRDGHTPDVDGTSSDAGVTILHHGQYTI